MAVRLEDVPTWIIQRGIGHACDSRGIPGIGWSSTLCGMLGNFREFSESRPRRICLECRRLLACPDVSLSKTEAHPHG
jgi:hypothetical protein